MANSLYDYKTAEASSSTTGGWNTAEGQDPATVNDGMRQHKQNVAGWLDDVGAVNTVGGTGNAITVTAAQPFSAYGTAEGQIGIGVLLRWVAGAANTGAATLNVNGLGAKKLRKISGGADVDVASGDIVAGETYTAIYRAAANGGAGAWVLIGLVAGLADGAVTYAKVAAAAIAAAADFRAKTASKLLDAVGTWNSADTVPLTDGTTIAVDMSTFINASVTIAGNRTLGQPSNTKNGQSGVIRIKQDATGSRTLAYHADWEFGGGTAPALSTAPNAEDLLFYQVLAPNRIFAALVKATA